jgi:hypothetical protein
MHRIWTAVALFATALLGSLFTESSKATAQGGSWRCIIASGGQMVYSKGGFSSFATCSAFCATNANIRALGGTPYIRWNCISGYGQIRTKFAQRGQPEWVMAVYRNGELIRTQIFATHQECDAACNAARLTLGTTCSCGPRRTYRF